MSDLFGESTGLSEGDAYELLEELELNRPEDVREVRAAASLQVRAEMIVRPANVCDRDERSVTGQTRELQTKGVSGLCARPVTPGSVFQLAFDRAKLDVPPILAVCDRCVMLQDDGFEAHFLFVHPIELPATTGLDPGGAPEE